MGGKGVKLSGEHLKSTEEAISFARSMMDQGQRVLVEEKFQGEEFTLTSFCDGVHLVHLPPVRDHKRAYEGDTGPNTGGMGSYTCSNHLLPFLSPHDVETARSINERMSEALLQHNGGKGFKGVLYGKFVCLRRGVGCIDFNARFLLPSAHLHPDSAAQPESLVYSDLV